MSRHSVDIVILCEDQQHNSFVRNILRHRKGADFNHHKVRSVFSPKGSQDARQFIFVKFPLEVAVHRSRAAHQNVCLIVVIDSDNVSVLERKNQLNELLAREQREPVSGTERIALLVPQRNIETWIQYLKGESVDETTTYPRLKRPRECKPLATAMSDMCRTTVPDEAPESLKDACAEIQRICQCR
jgi:hypothetical protein